MNEADYQTIERLPLSRFMEALQYVFCDLCRTSGLEIGIPSLDRMSRCDQKLLCHYALIMILHEAAPKQISSPLPQHASLHDCLGEVNAYLSEDSFTHVKPLVRSIVTRQAHADICRTAYDAVLDRPLVAPPAAVPIPPDAVGTEVYKSISEVWYDLDLYRIFFLPSIGADRTAQLFSHFIAGPKPLFVPHRGWRNWPADLSEHSMFAWLQDIAGHVAVACARVAGMPPVRHKLAATLDRTDARTPYAGFVDATAGALVDWAQVCAPIQLHPAMFFDRTHTWLRLAASALEILAAQYRRFVLGFTMCGHMLRIWSFDRRGALGSMQVSVIDEPERFVAIIAGFLTMGPAQLGADQSIKMAGGRTSFQFQPHADKPARAVVLDRIIRQQRCVAGRGTTTWRAYFDGEPWTPLVVKDYWAGAGTHEDALLTQAQERGVANMPRYLGGTLVRAGGRDPDNVLTQIRGDIDVQTGRFRKVRQPALQYVPHGQPEPTTAGIPMRIGGPSRRRGSTESIGDPNADTAERAYQDMRVYYSGPAAPQDRVHWRLVFGDMGTPLEDERDVPTLLEALAQCIGAHKSLLMVGGILHRDISPGNLLVNRDKSDPQRLGLLIDLDHAALVDDDEGYRSASPVRAGTFLFMSVGILRGLAGPVHSFMDDLESFFWVLFWICAGYRHPNAKGAEILERLGRNDREVDAGDRRFLFEHDSYDFGRVMTASFMPEYQCLRRCVHELRQLVFPRDLPWQTERLELYDDMQALLRRHKRYVEEWQREEEEALVIKTEVVEEDDVMAIYPESSSSEGSSNTMERVSDGEGFNLVGQQAHGSSNIMNTVANEEEYDLIHEHLRAFPKGLGGCFPDYHF
uniref:non-specific serine/threonine protein kinase n=1 Tax=Thielaviopsis paradoxa TaxID=13001 RepID=A0A2R4ZNE2_9PEZI|nr:TPA_exp: serine/threonine-protein kinase 2 [Thielaviopsis paradoxa]